MKKICLLFVLLSLFLSCKTTSFSKSPVEQRPAKCGVACMDQNALHLDTLENGNQEILEITINFIEMGENLANESIINKNIGLHMECRVFISTLFGLLLSLFLKALTLN